MNEHTGYGWRTVQCVECCASTSEAGVYTAAEAAARWNRRAADQPAAAEFDPQPTVLTDDECEYIIGFMDVREWEGLTRDDVRLWAKALDELLYLRAADNAAAQPDAGRCRWVDERTGRACAEPAWHPGPHRLRAADNSTVGDTP